MKHTGRVQEYIDHFDLALTQVNLIPEHSLSIFLAGLDYHTQMHVRMFNPTTIAHAANLAKLHEASLPCSTPLFIRKPTISSPHRNPFIFAVYHPPSPSIPQTNPIFNSPPSILHLNHPLFISESPFHHPSIRKPHNNSPLHPSIHLPTSISATKKVCMHHTHSIPNAQAPFHRSHQFSSLCVFLFSLSRQ